MLKELFSKFQTNVASSDWSINDKDFLLKIQIILPLAYVHEQRHRITLYTRTQ